MSYKEHLNQTLQIPPPTNGLVLDLFAGCGGLALGFEAQGFETIGYELNEDACKSYERNLHGRAVRARLTPDYLFPEARIIIGGPPCQPFSGIGNQAGQNDSRDGFPTFVSAVRRLRPELFLIENVRGLFYRSRPYLDLVLDQLRDLDYVVDIQLLNAVDYGVPQNRERVIIVGHRGYYQYPQRLNYRFTAGDAVMDILHEGENEGKYLTSSMDAYVAVYEAKSNCITPRDLHFDRPARTVTCRNLGGATSDMHRVKLADGRRRRLTMREGARLQSFPDWFDFYGSEGSVYDQIGNAVPPMFAYQLAASVAHYLGDNRRRTISEIRDINRASKGLLFV